MTEVITESVCQFHGNQYHLGKQMPCQCSAGAHDAPLLCIMSVCLETKEEHFN